MKPVKVNAKYQITLPRAVREKLNIRVGDQIIVDVQDAIMVLIPEPRQYSKCLQGLHREIWEDVDAQRYLDGERNAWGKINP